LAAAQHIRQQRELHIVETVLLAVVETLPQLGFRPAPIRQSLERYIEPAFDKMEIAIVFLEQVQRFNFTIESVAA
jgi:hypothetical protein